MFPTRPKRPETRFYTYTTIIEEKDYTISQENRHSKCDYTTYEGFKSNFKVDTVISRGKLILDSRGFYALKGDGHFIKRKF